jgi:glycosyltransferase involved in cell wall biosynthesis
MNELRVLQVGAHENLIYGLYKSFNQKNIKITFDYVMHLDGVDFKYKNDIGFDGKLHYMPPISKGVINWMINFRKIVNKEKYKIVHFHIGFSTVFGLLALINLSFVNYKICHSHSNYKSQNIISKCARLFSKIIIYFFSNKNLACSYPAGKCLFIKNFEILNNAVPYKDFVFNIFNRELYREKFKFKESEKVIGHIGNFYYPKNQVFLINIFFEIFKMNSKYKLLLVGDDLGSMEEVQKEIIQLNLQENVLILNDEKKISQILSAIDFIIFPSIFEGLPLALIESQVNGIPCLYSNVIPDEVKISKTIFPYSLNYSAKDWAIEAYKLTNDPSITNLEYRKTAMLEISQNFDSATTGIILENIYLNAN